MAWFPARDKQGKVIPEYLCFPRPTCESDAKRWQGGALYVRQYQRGAGRENKGPGQRNIQYHLSEHARGFGFHNGRRLKKEAA